MNEIIRRASGAGKHNGLSWFAKFGSHQIIIIAPSRYVGNLHDNAKNPVGGRVSLVLESLAHTTGELAHLVDGLSHADVMDEHL